MSMIVDAIKRRGRPPVPSGPEKAPPVAAKLDAASAELADTIAEYSDAALAEAIGDPDGASRLVTVKARRAQLEQRVADLEAAHAAAVQSDQRMFAAQRAAMCSAQISAVKRHLRKREEAARKLDKAITEAVAAWNAMYAAGRAAQKANPLGGVWPAPSLCSPNDLGEAVRQHIRRLGGQHPAQPRKFDSEVPFPGTEPRGVGEHNPASCPNLLDELARIDKWLLDSLEGRKAIVGAARSVVVEQQEPAATGSTAVALAMPAPPDVEQPAPVDDREPWNPAIHAPLEWAAKQRAAAIARGEHVLPVEEQPDAEGADLLATLAAMNGEAP